MHHKGQTHKLEQGQVFVFFFEKEKKNQGAYI